MKKILSIILLVTMSLSLSGCSSKQSKICTTAYPIQYLVNKIGGERVTSCNISTNEIIQRATIVEDYEEVMDGAMALIHIGDLEPYYELYANDFKTMEMDILDLSLYASIYDFKRYTYVKSNNQEVVVEMNYYDNKSFDIVDMYSKDPILWIDPIAMTSMAKYIRNYLIEKMPESESYFNSNYTKLEAELALLDAEFQTLRNEGKQVKIVTMTPSFGNWQKPFGVQVYPVILSKYGTLPNSLQLEAIKERIVADGVKYIAKENNMTEDMEALYNELVADLNLKEVSLHNLSTLTQTNIDSNQDYIKIMYDNLAALESISE